MDIYKVIIFGIVFFILFTGLGTAILNLIYTWTKLKIEEIKEGVYR
jgi:Na+-translocating ferredoxin:NAD+ oxidoreductase RnfG subunit